MTIPMPAPEDFPLISLARIEARTEAQPRSNLDDNLIAEYAEAMKGEGHLRFPPIILFYDAENDIHYIGDGFHRYRGAEKAGLEAIKSKVHPGTLRDAVLYSCGANARHGLRRSPADKFRAVLTLLQDPEWTQWSDKEIAKRARVTNDYVGIVRKKTGHMVSERYCRRGNKLYKVRTDRIGRSPKSHEWKTKKKMALVKPTNPDASRKVCPHCEGKGYLEVK